MNALGVMLAASALIAGCACAPAPVPTTRPPRPTTPRPTTTRPTTTRPTTTRPTTTTTTTRPTTTTTAPPAADSTYSMANCAPGLTLAEALSDYQGNVVVRPEDVPGIQVEPQLVGCSTADDGMTNAIGLIRLVPPDPISAPPVVIVGPGFCLNNNPEDMRAPIENLLAEGRTVVIAYYALRNFYEPPGGVFIPGTMNDSVPGVAPALRTSALSLATLLNAVSQTDADYSLIGASCGSLITLNALAGGTVGQLPTVALLINGGSQLAGISWNPPTGLGGRLRVIAGGNDWVLPATATADVDAGHPFVTADATTGPDPRRQDARGRVVGNTQDVCGVLNIQECTIDPTLSHQIPPETVAAIMRGAGLLNQQG